MYLKMQIYFCRKVNLSMYQWKKDSVPLFVVWCHIKIIQSVGVPVYWSSPNQTPFPAFSFFLSATLGQINGRDLIVKSSRGGRTGGCTTHRGQGTSNYIMLVDRALKYWLCGPDDFHKRFQVFSFFIFSIWNLVCDY